MTSTNGDISSADALSNILAAATQNARHGSDIAFAAIQIIAKRVGLGVTASFDPLQADHVEFAQMISEKVEAFSAAGSVICACFPTRANAT